MDSTKQDDKEDHLEESYKDVGGSNHETDDTKDGGNGTLHNGKSKSVEAVLYFIIRSALTIKIVVRYVSRKINRKSEIKKEVLIKSQYFDIELKVWNILSLRDSRQNL